ncbi:siderophore ABC transporter substrate-binding protein [Clostridium senegalense]|uniref:siderophore ABC transporter substrate-binding protein n=1 Tax=Clostridium senegalense TaxID=1465809 RepID=UPI0002894980|nr:siderophore ABC transporter substrate-binding protein [Clostridium senegalense]
MSKKVLISILIIILFLIGGYSFLKFSNEGKGEGLVGDMVIEHRYGQTQVKSNPEKIVVLDYGSLDILDKMEIEPIALPKSNLPEYLSKYNDEKYSDLGALLEFDMEKINELKPDLIIIEGRQGKYYEELSKIAPTIGLGTVNNDHFKSLEDNIFILSKIFGKDAFGKKEVEKINKELDEINNKTTSSENNALIFMVNKGSISVFGQGSRFGMIYDKFGFKCADENLSGENNHGENVSYEYILSKNPEYIFVIDKSVIVGGEQKSAKEIMETDIVKNTNAYKNGKIIYLDPKAWYLGGSGISSTEIMISEIKKSL